MPMKLRDVIRLLHKDGWFEVAQRGSHRQFRHPTKPGKVTVAGHRGGTDVPPGTLKAILAQASIQEDLE